MKKNKFKACCAALIVFSALSGYSFADSTSKIASRGWQVDPETGIKYATSDPAKGSLVKTGAAYFGDDLFVWGYRGSAQQGNGTISVSSPTQPGVVTSLYDIQSLATGAYHLVAMDGDGKVWGWGQNGYGETGCYGVYVARPCNVINNATQIAAGEHFTIALDKKGQVWTWGHNKYGQLGNGLKANSVAPIAVYLRGETARLVGAADEGAFAVTKEGHVWAWGNNQASGLGIIGPKYDHDEVIRTPVRIYNLEQYADSIKYIAGGQGWGEALLEDGTVIGWGLAASLGVGVTKTAVSSPQPFVVMTGVKDLFARYIGSVAVTFDQEIYTWGNSDKSSYKTIYGVTPTRRYTNSPVTAIGGGKEHIFYKTAEGDLYGVGYNGEFKLNQSTKNGTVDWPGCKITFPIRNAE